MSKIYPGNDGTPPRVAVASVVVGLALVLLVSGCAPAVGLCDETDPFASEVVEVSFGSGQNFGQQALPEVVFGPPHGGGCCAGSTDVVSLGNGGHITLGFGDNIIIDGPGVDFVVFENAFESATGAVFAELATVEVSEDGLTWVAYPCATEAPPYDRCAGVSPVLLNGGVGPIDPDTSGGDGFDLGELGLASARYVRITDRPDIDGFQGVFDLDAVGIVHGDCR